MITQIIINKMRLDKFAKHEVHYKRKQEVTKALPFNCSFSYHIFYENKLNQNNKRLFLNNLFQPYCNFNLSKATYLLNVGSKSHWFIF